MKNSLLILLLIFSLSNCSFFEPNSPDLFEIGVFLNGKTVDYGELEVLRSKSPNFEGAGSKIYSINDLQGDPTNRIPATPKYHYQFTATYFDSKGKRFEGKTKFFYEGGLEIVRINLEPK